MLLLAAGARAGAGDPAPAGWSTVDLPGSQSHARLYVPAALDRSQPAPLVLFLHGAGSSPEHWQPYLPAPADAAGVVVLAPLAKGLGWGNPGDENVLAEALAGVRSRVLVDPRRIAIAGHSAGGAYAYQIAYGTLLGRLPRASGVFILSSPFYAVERVQDPAYTAPLRQFYGTTDPNYGTARDRLVAQWTRLGVPFEEEIDPGFGHSSWPDSTLVDGFRFLARQQYPGYSDSCAPDATSLCLRDGRYRVRVRWRTGAANGDGHAVPLAAGDSGLFWFFGANNIEMLVKVLDGCAVDGKVWVFASATTNVGFTLEVADTVAGTVRRYDNPLGRAAKPITDTTAFASCP